MSNPNATISADSRMKAVGKTPSRYNREREVVGFPQWTQFDALPHDLDTWSAEPDLGICVQTRHVRALDIDVDSDTAFDIEQAFLDVLGIELPVRCRSNSGKRLLAFIVEGDLAKRRFATADGAVELLATGQQFVAVGTHTSGVPYNWSGGLPTHIPTITLDQLDAAWQAIVDRFAVEPTASGEYASRRRGADLAIEDAVADHLYARNLVLDEGRDGALYVDCPWKHEHTSDSGITETAWYPAGTGGYDRDGTLFYLDPPYYGCEGDYGRDLFDRGQFELMAEQLGRIKGRFILSLNDHPEVRRIFDGFTIEAVETTYSVGGGANATKAGELIISN